ncbi:hypothetical protein E2C01_038991 [Portunus trituberculatus]|uniref:Uncharacterized protein n=1 Tax=Portunus trituberculatus TaxID=210409 RepID=A0A5B7FIN1_PORTR|nr:hypothetical protein [Portunus trituberculatus]
MRVEGDSSGTKQKKKGLLNIFAPLYTYSGTGSHTCLGVVEGALALRQDGTEILHLEEVERRNPLQMNRVVDVGEEEATRVSHVVEVVEGRSVWEDRVDVDLLDVREKPHLFVNRYPENMPFLPSDYGLYSVFKPVCLRTPQPPKHVWFHCTTLKHSLSKLHISDLSADRDNSHSSVRVTTGCTVAVSPPWVLLDRHMVLPATVMVEVWSCSGCNHKKYRPDVASIYTRAVNHNHVVVLPVSLMSICLELLTLSLPCPVLAHGGKALPDNSNREDDNFRKTIYIENDDGEMKVVGNLNEC